MSQPASELEIRERIATQIRANPEIGVVHSRGRGAINTETLVPLLLANGIAKGCVVRPIGFTQQDSPDKLDMIEKTIRYGLIFILTYDDDFIPHDEHYPSTDYFSDEMIARTDFLLSGYRSLGFGRDNIRHDLLQFPQDWTVTPSNSYGKFHLALGVLPVKWWIPANECD